MTRRRWIADSWADPLGAGATATLKDEQAAHLSRVLRAQPGMTCDVVAGDRVWHAEVVDVSDAAVTFRLIAEQEAASTLALEVLLSVFKFDRMEWAIEKLTELGVAGIQPVLVRRTEKHLAQAAANRVERWRRIALEAAKQSRRASVPAIGNPLPLKDALGQLPASSLKLLLAEKERGFSLAAALRSSLPEQQVVLAVGPEGGWAQEEETLFAQNGWTPVTLGATILRAETAAIAGVAIAAALLDQ